jgi:hypothetical protein
MPPTKPPILDYRDSLPNSPRWYEFTPRPFKDWLFIAIRMLTITALIFFYIAAADTVIVSAGTIWCARVRTTDLTIMQLDRAYASRLSDLSRGDRLHHDFVASILATSSNNYPLGFKTGNWPYTRWMTFPVWFQPLVIALFLLLLWKKTRLSVN